MLQSFSIRSRIFAGSVALCLPLAGFAQSSSSGAGQPPQAQQLPLSGRIQGGASVSAPQTASGSSSSSVNTVNTTIQVQGSYQGSIVRAVPGEWADSHDLSRGAAARSSLQPRVSRLCGFGKADPRSTIERS
jgi:ABC-type phosphate transport system substrate-binding protein